MEMKLLRPVDGLEGDVESEEVTRLKDRSDFNNPIEWAVYQAKVFYEGFRDIEKATSILEKALQEDASNPDLMFCLAECYSRREEKYARSLELCKEGLKIKESDYGITIKARVHYQKGELPKAYRAARLALMINLNNYEALLYHNVIGFQYASIERDVNRMKKHIENLEMAVKMFPESTRLKKILVENKEIYRRHT